MKYKGFQKLIKKEVFSTSDAQIIAFRDSSEQINLQLHQWKKNGDLVQLKRGVYMFANKKPNPMKIAKELCEPCYFSLEYILSLHGIIPEAVFSYTLVTPHTTKSFATPVGRFIYRKIKPDAFIGYDSETLMADKEKALADYFYLNMSRLKANDDFWKESRIDVLNTDINFKKVLQYAKLFHSKKLEFLLHSLYLYAKTQ